MLFHVAFYEIKRNFAIWRNVRFQLFQSRIHNQTFFSHYSGSLITYIAMNLSYVICYSQLFLFYNEIRLNTNLLTLVNNNKTLSADTDLNIACQIETNEKPFYIVCRFAKNWIISNKWTAPYAPFDSVSTEHSLWSPLRSIMHSYLLIDYNRHHYT